MAIHDAFKYLGIASDSLIQSIKVENPKKVPNIINKLVFDDVFPKKRVFYWRDIIECYIFSNYNRKDSFVVITNSKFINFNSSDLRHISIILSKNSDYYRKSLCLTNLNKKWNKDYHKYHGFKIYSINGDSQFHLILIHNFKKNYTNFQELIHYLNNIGRLDNIIKKDGVDFLEIIPS